MTGCRRALVAAAVALVSALATMAGALVLLDLDGIDALHGTIPAQIRPHRPLVIRFVNFFLGPMAAALIPLEVDGMVQAACAAVGDDESCFLHDPNEEDGWREALGILLESLNREAELTFFGRFFAKMAVGNALQQRAALGAYWRESHRSSEPAHSSSTSNLDSRIRRPIIIAGLPRTGTTLLQELLSQDPRHRAPRTWELMEPVPPPPCPDAPGQSANGTDGVTTARIARVQSDIDNYKKLAPGIDSFHPISARRPRNAF